MYASIDACVSTIERQIRKNKTRLAKNLRETAFAKDGSDFEEDVPEEGEFDIRRKDFKLEPMTVDEAILQMNLLEHSFFVFKDADTGSTNVVYKRHADKYGLIITE